MKCYFELVDIRVPATIATVPVLSDDDIRAVCELAGARVEDIAVFIREFSEDDAPPVFEAARLLLRTKGKN